MAEGKSPSASALSKATDEDDEDYEYHDDESLSQTATEGEDDDDVIRLPDGSFISRDEIDVISRMSRTRSQSEVAQGLSESLVSVYGKPVSPEEAAEQVPPGEGGLVWHASLVTEGWKSKSDCDAEGNIKPRRASLPVRHEDFFSSLVQVADGRWIFSGVLNGWPGMTAMELVSITCKVRTKMLGRPRIKRFWDASTAVPAGVKPTFPQGPKSVRATLRMAPWTAHGWSPDAPGCLFWFFAQRSSPERGGPAPVLEHGENIIRRINEDAAARAAAAAAAAAGGDLAASHPKEGPLCVRAHLFAHRYAKKKESNKDRLTYHSAVLLEWDHGEHCTVVELATLNGSGGRRGKSNWIHDGVPAVSNPTPLYRAMPPRMVVPWRGEFAEIRVCDVEARSIDEFKAFVARYDSFDKPDAPRFIDPHFHGESKSPHVPGARAPRR